MLTDHRTVLLEARDLIDFDCRDSIQAKLRLGQRAGAATELIEYFEDNHDGDKMMEFCSFLEDQAGSTAPVLKKLANVIQGCVEMLSGESVCICGCVSVCVKMYVCICAYVYASVYLCMYMCVCVCKHIILY